MCVCVCVREKVCGMCVCARVCKNVCVFETQWQIYLLPVILVSG